MDRKGIIAVVLCGIVLIAYFPLMSKFSPKKPIQEELANEGTEQIAVQNEFEGLTPERADDLYSRDDNNISSSSDFEEPAQQEASAQQEISAKQEVPDEQALELHDYIVIQNENIRSIWTNDGAALKSVTLKHYKNGTKVDLMELIQPTIDTFLPLSISKLKVIRDENVQEVSLANRRFEVVDKTDNQVSFQTTFKNGLQVIKKITLAPDGYHVNMDITFRNKSDRNITYEYQLTAAAGVVYEGDDKIDMMSVVGIDKGNGKYKLVKTHLKNLPESNQSLGISWVGNVNKYFAAILIPKSNSWVHSVNSRPLVTDGEVIKDFMTTIRTNSVVLRPQNEIKNEYTYFLGPKRKELLTKYNLNHLLGFGMFAPISNMLLKVLNGFYKVIPNYGLAILFMTLLVKLMLFPLSRKSQMSMFKMQALQPKIEELKKKYKTDKQSMAKAQMQLFKKHGANPLGGCLPMVLQLPVFFALFRTLQNAFEMRQAPFVGWISDLSLPDTLITLPFTIPLLGNMLNILPIIMTGASFIQMRLNPKTPSADPQAKMQQKMMSFMPLMFCFILYKMPSGLTLYWTTSTMLGICENLFIRKTLKKLKHKI